LTTLSPEYPQAYGVSDPGPDPVAPDWVPVSDVVAAMISGKGPHLGISPAVAGARLAGSLGYAVAGRPAVALAAAGRMYDTGPESLMMRLDDEGLVERIGVRNRVLAVTEDDPVAGRDEVLVLPDRPALIRWAAPGIWTALDRLIDEVHERTRYGRIPMWNLVADSVLGPAAAAAASAGLDHRVGYASGQALLDALVELGAPIHRRGSLLEPPGELLTMRGSCCLYFRQDEEKCGTCPLIRQN
jgi:hypothetical protein